MFKLPCFVLSGLPWLVLVCCSFLGVTDDLRSIDCGFQNYPGTNIHDALNHTSGRREKCTESLKTPFPFPLGWVVSFSLFPALGNGASYAPLSSVIFLPPAYSNPRSYLVTSSTVSTMHLLFCFWDSSVCHPLAIAYPFPKKTLQERLWNNALEHCSDLSLILV